MNRALYAAASGMAAQQQNLEIIANNLANADVAGFKSASASFTDIALPGGSGLGTAQLGAHVIFEQGKLAKSGGPFDMAIEGQGFFCVVNARGQRAYTRDGEFSRERDGSLRNAQGWQLSGVRIPADAVSVSVAEDGRVTAQLTHGTRACGMVRLAQFASPEHLQSLGGTLFRATRASGTARTIALEAPDGPKIRFGMIEQSNVSIVEAMMEILAAQRAYEANAKGVQAADEMLRIADNLNRA